MRTHAIASLRSGPLDQDGIFTEVELDLAPPGPHDLLVEVRAVSVNPVDVKVRASFTPDGTPKVLGFDAAGVVTAVGAEVSAFTVGDEVYYAGSIARPGSNARLQLVDERIVGHKPATLDFAEAAALPLTTITAWETLFDRLRLTRASTGTLLVLPLKSKSQSWHWELMFSRPLFAPADTYQRDLLDETAKLVDQGVLRSTLTTRLPELTPATLREAHRQVESSRTVGKVVLSV